MAKQFKWTADATLTRNRAGVKGRRLERDATYNYSDFDAAVVDEWIRSGHAELVGEAKSKKEVKEV